MKRIIDGVTYNTDTSTRLARSEYESEYNHRPCQCIGTMYQTRGGAYFEVQALHLGWDDELQQEDYKYKFDTYTADQVRSWLLSGEVEVFHNPFDEPPEAEAEVETGATMYVRMPNSLKQRIEAAAKSEGLSGNSWTMRCAENCLARGNAEEERAALKKYLADALSTANGKGPITVDRLKGALEHVAAVAAGW